MATKARNPVLAALASLTLPGLGQLYNGQPILAGAFAGAYLAVSAVYTVRLFGALSSAGPEQAIAQALAPLGIMMLVWLGGVVQAVFGALNRPDYELQGYNRGLVYLGLYGLVYIVLPLVAWQPIFNWVLARNGIVTPAQRAEWLSRLAAGRTGQVLPAARVDPVPVAGDQPLELRDPEVDFAHAPTAIHLVLVGGRDGGIYDVAAREPSCTHRGGASPGWSNLYTNPADSLGVTAVELQVPVETGESSQFRLRVNVGNLPEGRIYEVDPEADGGSATVERRGGEVVLRLTGSTAQSVRIEATVQCREVVGE